jgi:hypothetical protein
MKSNTIITACNEKFVWGAILLIASVRRSGMKTPIRVCVDQVSAASINMLEQFDDVVTFTIDSQENISLHSHKPNAMLSAETDLISWMDSDGYVVGDISPLIDIADDDSMMARVKSAEEEQTTWLSRYASDEKKGEIPSRVLQEWKRDISDLAKPRRKFTITSCSYIVQHKHKEFLQLLVKQNQKILGDSGQIVNKKSFAYPLSDESVINSLLLFSESAPAEIKEWTLNKDPNCHFYHFQGKNKPWVRWNKRHFNYFDHVMDTICWIEDNGYQLPLKPRTLLKHNKKKIKFEVMLQDIFDTFKTRVRNAVDA